MKIKEIISCLDQLAPPSLQESYDNAGLLTGDAGWECSGAVVCLDAIEDVVDEAISAKCNLVIAHHPIIFGGLKKINGKNYVERCVIKAIKNDIAIYAIHTNLDNVLEGVNARIAVQLGLINCQVLLPKENQLRKLYTFVPVDHIEKVRTALFNAGAGHIGNYSECSFNAEGTGTFKASENTRPFVGNKNERHYEKEIRLEMVFPSWLEISLIRALQTAHPYEEVAYDIIALRNDLLHTGSGLIGELPDPVTEKDFLSTLKSHFGTGVIRHTALLGKKVSKVALCGGAGSFLVRHALAAGADFFVTADMKYHEFFDADGRMVIADIGHYESEQFTISLLFDRLAEKFPTFALLKTKVATNPVHYF